MSTSKRREQDYYKTCGKDRGPLTPIRNSWGFIETVFVPRIPDPERKLIQMINDLIVGVNIYRNGGTCETMHLCDDCLRIGLRHLLCVASRMLEETTTGDYVAANDIAELTERLGKTRARLNNLTLEHNRMQDRLRAVMDLVGNKKSEAVDMARWEVQRGHATLDWQS